MISIDKNKKISYTSDKKKGFEIWRRFIGSETLKEAEEIAKGNPMLEGALEEMKRFSGYKGAQDYSREQLLIESRLNEAEQNGIEQGATERNFEIAKNLLSLKIDINSISKATGLSLEQLKSLEKEINKDN